MVLICRIPRICWVNLENRYYKYWQATIREALHVDSTRFESHSRQIRKIRELMVLETFTHVQSKERVPLTVKPVTWFAYFLCQLWLASDLLLINYYKRVQKHMYKRLSKITKFTWYVEWIKYASMHIKWIVSIKLTRWIGNTMICYTRSEIIYILWKCLNYEIFMWCFTNHLISDDI